MQIQQLKAMQMMLDGSEYKAIKTRYEHLNVNLLRNKTSIENTDSNYIKYLNGSVLFLKM